MAGLQERSFGFVAIKSSQHYVIDLSYQLYHISQAIQMDNASVKRPTYSYSFFGHLSFERLSI